MESLEELRWPEHIGRQESGTSAGRGIFAKRHIASGACVARYWGHLVDFTGLIHIKCESTTNLLMAVPDARRPFSKAHAVSLMGQPVNLFVDGSHHTGSKYDTSPNRNGIPWGACLNSSFQTGVAANCELRWLPGPSFEPIREASRKLGNSNNLQEKSNTFFRLMCTDVHLLQGFLFARREIAPEEELRWKYNHNSSAHQDGAGCRSPPIKAAPSKRECSLAPFESPLTVTKSQKLDTNEDPTCVCPGANRCILGKCWGYGKQLTGKRMPQPSAKK
jgi:hypothetical protein